MSTPKISFRVPGGTEPAEVSGDVTVQDVASAPGKEREREPMYGGELSNISEGMAVDTPVAGQLLFSQRLVDGPRSIRVLVDHVLTDRCGIIDCSSAITDARCISSVAGIDRRAHTIKQPASS